MSKTTVFAGKVEVQRYLRDSSQEGTNSTVDTLDVRVTISDQGVGISIEGYGMQEMQSGPEAELIWLEFNKGQADLMVWSDINIADPIRVDLERAREEEYEWESNPLNSPIGELQRAAQGVCYE